MTPPLLAQELRLAHRALQSFPDAAGLEFCCREGSVWVTLDGDPRDYILEAGESFTTAEHRRAVVYAFETSVVTVSPSVQARPEPTRRGHSGANVQRLPLATLLTR